jgi:cytochrome P450
MDDGFSSSTMTDGTKRLQQRRLLQPAFSNDALNAYVPLMVAQVEESLAALVREDGRAFDMRSEVRTVRWGGRV